ncbi:MAG: phosphatase PAP2 family protein [Alphaproteobacteria bacterium]
MKRFFQDKSVYKNISKITIAVVFVCLFVVISHTASADSKIKFSDIKFGNHQWGKEFTNFIDLGPSILGRDEFFDVAPPPVNDSQITKDELSFLQEIAETKRDEDAVLRIHYENVAKNPQEFFAKEGLLNIESYKTVDLLSMIDEDHRYFILERKKHFARARPSQLDESLSTVIPNPAHASYPSGHASQSYMIALVLSEFDPENANKYKQFAIDVAHRREIAGVHYPSDSEAGRTLAIDVLARLRSVPVFEKKFQEAKASHLKPDFVRMTDEETDSLTTIKDQK